MSAAHERSEFRNSARWTVSIAFTAAGGARPRTARDRAERVAARLASAAARVAGVVDVTAVSGPSDSSKPFEPLAPQRVFFDAANSGHGTYGRPDLLSRYVDPEHERALTSLAEANRAFEARRRADEQRRRAVDCANTYQLLERRFCECVYCAPATFLAGLTTPYPESSPHPINRPRCVCGLNPVGPERRCTRHRDVRIVVLDDDLAAVAEAARLDPVTAHDGGRG